MSKVDLPEELIRFVQVLEEDEDLRAWFESFSSTPEWQRSEEFRKLAARMHSAGEHPDLIRATALLAEAPMYRAIVATLSGDSR